MNEYLMFVGNASFRNPPSLPSGWAPTSYTAFHTLPKDCILDSVVHYDIDPSPLPITIIGGCKATDTYTYRVYRCGDPQPIATFVGSQQGITCESFPDPKPTIPSCSPIFVTVELLSSTTNPPGGVVGDPFFTLYIREIL